MREMRGRQPSDMRDAADACGRIAANLRPALPALARRMHGGKARRQGTANAPPSNEPHRTNGSRIMYQSDITQFINQLKTQKPSLEEEQRRGRALLWDKQPIDLDERDRQQTSRVKQTPYVYYQNF
jgi:hypothetical protein